MFEKKNYKLVGESTLLISPVTLGTMTFGEQNTQKDAFVQLDSQRYAAQSGAPPPNQIIHRTIDGITMCDQTSRRPRASHANEQWPSLHAAPLSQKVPKP